MAEVKVTVEKVRKVMHHPNADRLDLATVRGWQVIVGRDQYREGDLCVYVPIDSVLPVDLAHEWDVAKYLRGNMRIRTLKLRGSISQGLVIPHWGTHKDGDDVTKNLGIKKWVPKGKPGGGMRLQQGQKMNPNRSTPWFPRYTNIDHLNNNPMAFEDTDWIVVHEKRHGTNFRMGFVKKYKRTILERLSELKERTKKRLGWNYNNHRAAGCYLHVGSHNVIREWHPNDLYWKAACKVLVTSRLQLPNNKVFFFEISGPGVQTGFDYGVEEGDDFIVEVIDIFCTSKERYLSIREVAMMCSQIRLTEVPCLLVGEWRMVKETFEAYADGNALGADHIREGVVLKGMDHKNRKIFKFISPDYLIHQGKKKPEDETEWH